VKTYKHLFPEIVSFEKLLMAAQKAQKGKRFKRSTALFNLNLEKELLCLQRELTSKTYSHGLYTDFVIHDPKQRLISAAPYRDRVVHHALCNVIEPIFDPTFIHDSYACRKGKGTHKAVDRYTSFARKSTYVLKCDISKYFQSIDHEVLMSIVAGKIRCADTQWLIEEIICSRIDKSQITYFPGDDLFTPSTRERGIPIGNLSSQFFSNLYLDGMDHFIKETLNCHRYVRYVDNFVVLDDSKQRLREIKKEIEDYLVGLRLKLNPRKSRIHRVKDGIRFLGYRVFPTHRLLDKGNALRMRRRMKQMAAEYENGNISLDKVRQRIQSWIGHAAHADTWKIRGRILGGMAFTRDAAQNASGGLLEQQS
jgi:retron-type reverse transcriptase